MPRLQASDDYRPDKQKTYATTDDCLKGVHDDGLRALFVEHTTLTALRKHLLLRRKPVFFHQRRLLNEHLIRPDGTPRTSIAEIAYAVKHDGTTRAWWTPPPEVRGDDAPVGTGVRVSARATAF